MHHTSLTLIGFVVLGFQTFASPTILCSQERFTIGDASNSIQVSSEEYRKLINAREIFDDKIDLMRESLRATQLKIQKYAFRRDSEVEKLLSPGKLKSLNEDRLSETRKQAKINAEHMVKFAKFVEHVSNADGLRIYEGLPRASAAELVEIKKKDRTVVFGDWSFYEKPLTPRQSLVEQLRATLIDYRSFDPYTGGKFCGGFHPDFCVEWTTKGKTYRTLICLTCFEAEFITPAETTTFDFNHVAWKSFVQIASSTFLRHKNVVEKLDEMLGK